MKCNDCGNEMIKGKLNELSPVTSPWYQFTPDNEVRDIKTGNYFSENSSVIEGKSLRTDAWQCPHCRKVMLWIRPVSV